MENQFDNIMDRIRARQNEMSGGDDSKENVVQKPTKQEESPTKVFGISTKANDVHFRPGEPKETTPKSSVSEDSKPSTTKKASRFSMLAQEQEDFEFDYTSQYNKPKEAYMKGRSPRMSIGETRASVLCAPKVRSPAKVPEQKNGPEFALGMSDFEARRIKFAQPISNVNYLPNESSIFSGGSSSANDMSTVLGGSAEMMNVTTSSLSCGELSLNQHVTHENTMINAQSCDNREAILRNMDNMSQDEYGAHTFMRKKVPTSTKTTSSPPPKTTTTTTVTTSSTSNQIFQRPNIQTLISSPKPFSKDIASRAVYSPVHFTPKSTSSPKTTVPPVVATETVLSPSKSAALEGSVATTRRMQFEKQLRQNTNQFNPPTAPVPTPRHAAPIQSTPHHPYQAQQKKNLFPAPTPKPLVATAPIPVQTQWRGQANTPVVQGARAEDKTAGTQLVGAGVGKLKNLKSRWEFCSTTGTPIHPDATEDSLIATAIKMKETTIPTRIAQRGYSQKQNPIRSSTASPAAKTIRKEDYVEYEDDDDVFEEEPSRPTSDDDEILDDMECKDTSRFIDDAFGFMEATGVTGTTTPSPFREAPLAKAEESPVSPKKNLRKEVIEEEDVEESSDDDTEVATPPEDVTTASEVVPQRNDSQLAYSVSFYRKFQRERVGEASTTLSSVSPSAPVASLTSPQKLKQLTTPRGGGRIMESEMEAMRRIGDALKIEQALVLQSQRALARARDQPNFRGSREEFEAQRALLVHVEKHRALNAENMRMQREGARIIDGPRGNLSIVQLSVSLDREFVKQHIESSVKPEDVFYFVAILRYAEQVDVSKMVTSDNGVNRRGTLDFPTPMKLTAIPPDFKATLEIYGQKSVRESTTHEDKFKLKGSTMKAKNADTWCYYVDRSERESRLMALDEEKRSRKGLPCRLWKKLHDNRPTFLGGGSTSSGNQSLFTSKEHTFSTNPSSSCSSTSFNLLASISLDMNSRGREIYTLPQTIYPLSTELHLKVKKEAVDGADIEFKGFLSMYQRTNEGLGSWTRYYCILDNGEMKFWRHPEDVESKSYLVLMDLSTCCRSEGASVVKETCPYPNSFHIDVWAPKDDPSDGIIQLRVMLAADTPQALQEWLSVINSTSRQLCTWRNPIRA